MLNVDEAARVSDSIYGAVHPCLGTTNGRTILMSTPSGRQGFFYEAWTDGSDWDRISTRNARASSREFIEKKRRRMDDGYFRQEFQCEFHAADDQYFSPNIISKCLIDEWDGWIPEVFRENPGVAALIAAGAPVARSEEARPRRVPQSALSTNQELRATVLRKDIHA